MYPPLALFIGAQVVGGFLWAFFNGVGGSLDAPDDPPGPVTSFFNIFEFFILPMIVLYYFVENAKALPECKEFSDHWNKELLRQKQARQQQNASSLSADMPEPFTPEGSE
jgi:hypothetical protein